MIAKSHGSASQSGFSRHFVFSSLPRLLLPGRADRLAAALAAAVAGRGDVTSDIVGGGTKREGGEGAGVGKTHELHPCMTTKIRLVPTPRRSAVSYVVPSL